jgi:hypothetical protein
MGLSHLPFSLRKGHKCALRATYHLWRLVVVMRERAIHVSRDSVTNKFRVLYCIFRFSLLIYTMKTFNSNRLWAQAHAR